MINVSKIAKHLILLGLMLRSVVSYAEVATTKPVVAVSVEPLALIVREICAEVCEVLPLVPKGVSEHSWQPGPKDIVKAKSAVAAVGIGLGFDEAWFKKIGYDETKLLLLGKGLDPMPWWSDDMGAAKKETHNHGSKKKSDHADHHDHQKLTVDPHVWIDARRMSSAATLISSHLAKSVPAGAAGFQDRARVVADRLLKLQLDVETRRKTWRTRPVVMFHDLAGYFARRFSLPVLAVSVGNGGHDLSAKMIADVSKRFKGSRVAAILVEREDGAAKSLARELNTTVKVVDFSAAKAYQNWDQWYLHIASSWEDVLKSP